MASLSLANKNKLSSNHLKLLRSTKYLSQAFTIVELLVVIVIIAILATITIVSYTGITKQSTVASVQANLKQLTTTIDLDHATNNIYPATLLAVNSGKGFPTTSGVDYSYKLYDSATYCASASSSTQTDIVYHYIPTEGKVKSGACPALICPTGFIIVPGSATYSTNDFCVMKYEARIKGNNNGWPFSDSSIPESRATGTPWTNIDQAGAITASTKACSGCHLITEAEWMTIAQNVLGVASNWSGGAVGSGYIYSGHNDDNPGDDLAASTDDSNGYYGTNNSSTDTTITANMVGKSQRRTLTLSNGEVIWDLAGNIWEWTTGQTTGGQPGISGAGAATREWTAITTPGSLAVNPFPSGTGISGASSWDSSKGIGQIYSDSGVTAYSRSINRGGCWYMTKDSGVLAIDLNDGPVIDSGSNLGFRVSR
jgi:prepilin-type N-terminal cleavage/methylation domain-containing protein